MGGEILIYFEEPCLDCLGQGSRCVGRSTSRREQCQVCGGKGKMEAALPYRDYFRRFGKESMARKAQRQKVDLSWLD